MYIDRRVVEDLKRQYPKGTKVIVEEMRNDPRPIAPGTRGEVVIVDDIGTVHCVFENGRRLGLVPGEDSFRALKNLQREAER